MIAEVLKIRTCLEEALGVLRSVSTVRNVAITRLLNIWEPYNPREKHKNAIDQWGRTMVLGVSDILPSATFYPTSLKMPIGGI